MRFPLIRTVSRLLYTQSRLLRFFFSFTLKPFFFSSSSTSVRFFYLLLSHHRFLVVKEKLVGAEMLNPSYGERWNRTVIDDNMLAMFDASETKDPHQDTLDDRTKNHFFVFFH